MLRSSNRVQVFYTTTQKQVLDVHEEARRIAVSTLAWSVDCADRRQDEKKGTAAVTAETGDVKTAPGGGLPDVVA